VAEGEGAANHACLSRPAHGLSRLRSEPLAARDLEGRVDQVALGTSAQKLGGDAASLVRGLLEKDAVPFLDGYVYTDAGLDKRKSWLRTWDLQRDEDLGTADTSDIQVPPPYSQGSRGQSKDFRSDTYWRLRGKLDVPKERFISYPGCESDEDHEPLYGWAGWDHLQQAQALASLYEQRKSEGWDKQRLTPMLAGLLELLPWLKQWHNEPSAAYDGQRLGDYFEQYLDGEHALHGLSREDLRAWRPVAKSGRKKS
jgi:hypothetical protein